MGNREHLKILKKGVAAWNKWKRQNNAIRPNLAGVDLSKADLVNADLGGVRLSGANLSYAKLDRAFLYQADLRSAILQHGSLQWARLARADLSGANLSYANFDWALLAGANLSRATLHFTSFGGRLDLSSVESLHKVRHRAPSAIGTDTLARTAQGLSRDRARQGEVEVFFRGAGVEEQFIELFRSMIGQPIEFYSCFISYSHADKHFARLVYDSLQGRGVRCWLDEKGLRPGDRIDREINEAIRVNDRVLLCCSEDSLQSSWVEDEIAAAVKKEREIGQDILIPLNLDDYFFDWTGDHAIRIQERLAADFNGWQKDNAKFSREFEKVVDALRPRSEE